MASSSSNAQSSSSTSSSSLSPVDKSRPVVLCGPSGVGKSTLLKRLFAEFPGEYGFSVSREYATSASTLCPPPPPHLTILPPSPTRPDTTRSPRPGETPGESYHYVSRTDFESLISSGAFLEHATFGGNLYGTTAAAVEAVSSQRGQRAILDIDAQGVKILKRDHADRLKPVYIFIGPPNLEALYNRLKGRGTETAKSVLGRLSMAEGELGYARSNGGREFDVVVVNDDLERAYGVFRRAVREGPTQEWRGDELPREEEDQEVLERAKKDSEAEESKGTKE